MGYTKLRTAHKRKPNQVSPTTGDLFTKQEVDKKKIIFSIIVIIASVVLFKYFILDDNYEDRWEKYEESE